MNENDFLILRAMKNERQELVDKLNQVNNIISQSPEGTLRAASTKKGTQYYYKKFDSKKGESIERYISKRKEYDLIQQVAQKEYLIKLKDILEKEIRTIDKFCEEFDPELKSKIYEDLIKARKMIVMPMYMDNETRAKNWAEQDTANEEYYSEGLIFKTSKGEMVRSKSEVIIADYLYRAESIMYKYELPININDSLVLHPDFTIFNINTGKIWYWEHAGKMDDFNYVNSFVRKINTYAENDILLGQNLLVTYETVKSPLDINTVLKNIEIIKNS